MLPSFASRKSLMDPNFLKSMEEGVVTLSFLIILMPLKVPTQIFSFESSKTMGQILEGNPSFVV